MTPRDLVVMALRLLALLLGFQAIGTVIPMAILQSSIFAEDGPASEVMWTGTVLSAVWAVAMFVLAPSLARLVAPGEPSQRPLDALRTVDRRDMLRLLLRVVGAFALVWTVPEIVGQGLWRIEVPSTHRSVSWSELVPPLCKLLMALYFLRGAPQLVDWAYPQDNETNDPSTPGDPGSNA